MVELWAPIRHSDADAVRARVRRLMTWTTFDTKTECRLNLAGRDVPSIEVFRPGADTGIMLSWEFENSSPILADRFIAVGKDVLETALCFCFQLDITVEDHFAIDDSDHAIIALYRFTIGDVGSTVSLDVWGDLPGHEVVEYRANLFRRLLDVANLRNRVIVGATADGIELTSLDPDIAALPDIRNFIAMICALASNSRIVGLVGGGIGIELRQVVDAPGIPLLVTKLLGEKERTRIRGSEILLMTEYEHLGKVLSRIGPIHGAQVVVELEASPMAFNRFKRETGDALCRLGSVMAPHVGEVNVDLIRLAGETFVRIESLAIARDRADLVASWWAATVGVGTAFVQKNELGR